LLDVYRPAATAATARPAILLVHGGGFGAGDKRQPLYEKMAGEFARAGYVAFSTNYRLNPEKKLTVAACENAFADVLAAWRWIKERHRDYGLDPDRMIIAGDSAGGAIAVKVGYDQAAGKVGGCINLWGGMAPINPVRAHVPPWDQPITAYPLPAEVPPTCIIHGTEDRVVPLQTSEELANELARAGVPHELHLLRDAPHYPEARAGEFIPIMLRFAQKWAGTPASNRAK
jgi:acetyl esterase/lipase